MALRASRMTYRINFCCTDKQTAVPKSLTRNVSTSDDATFPILGLLQELKVDPPFSLSFSLRKFVSAALMHNVQVGLGATCGLQPMCVSA